MKKTKFSILIANYNNEKYINRCVESCLNQNINEKYEIILIDDNSSDNSLKKINKFKNKIKIIEIKKSKKGLKFNTYFQLNTYLTGLLKAKGEIICFLDSDDYFKDNKLSVINDYFIKKNLLEIIFDMPILIDKKKKLTIKKIFLGLEKKSGLIFHHKAAFLLKEILYISLKKDYLKINFH